MHKCILMSHCFCQKTVQFMEELKRIIPNSEVRVRKGLDLKKIIPQAKEKGFTALVVVNEDRKLPSILLVFVTKLLFLYFNSSRIDGDEEIVWPHGTSVKFQNTEVKGSNCHLATSCSMVCRSSMSWSC